MRRALVTGGGGFIGLALVRELRRLGVETTVVGRNYYPTVEQTGARCAVGDICDPDFLAAVTAGHDTVFHVAAKAGIWGSRESYYSVNVQGTANVLAACRKNLIGTLIYTSTPSVVFNQSDLAGVDENQPYAEQTLCHYAATKIEAEKMVLAANSEELRTTALRPHLVWGPGDTNLIPRLVARGKSRSLRIVGEGRNQVDISYIDNVVQAHLLAAENLHAAGEAAGQAFFISQGEPVSLWSWINELFAELKLPRVNKKISFPAAYGIGWTLEKIYSLLDLDEEPKMTRFLAEQLAKSHWFSIEKARHVLRYEPRISAKQGLVCLLAELRRHLPSSP